ncbi:carbohydrate ABC transporter permease [uncultured Amnibacterium sp.]|uniref:carbohydrate ABC transporter permease n=1 Tax=uncultured Amnibacterium sp. TaxID=1631851 RepID=UPI0035CBB881
MAVTTVVPRPGATRPARRVDRPRSTGPRVTRRAQARLGILMVAPLMVVTIVFFVVPLVSSIYYSLIDYDGISATPAFVGLGNFIEMFSDPEVWHALGNNLIWIVLGTAAPLLLGLAFALLLWTVKRGSRFYRLALFFPYVMPGVAIGITWGWIYDPIDGWLNVGLRAIGLGGLATGWLGQPSTALLAVLATAIWGACGFVMIIFLSALQNVDQELIDAARLDRANTLQRIQHVVLPQIMPVFIMVTTVTLVGGFSVFDIVFIMTQAGPANASNVLGTYAFTNAFQLNQISYGTAIALLITALSIPCAVALNRLQRRLSIEGMGS